MTTARSILSFVLLFSVGCTANKKVDTSLDVRPQVRERPTAQGDIVVEVDLDGDDQPNIFNYYKDVDGENRILLRKEMDLNRDGRIDVWTFYDEAGQIIREEMDSDFDGVVDWIDHYQGDKRVMSEVDTQNDGRFDLFKYYEGGRIHRKERDTTRNGKVDHWEYFDEKGNVIKVGWDVDNDGIMDVRSE